MRFTRRLGLTVASAAVVLGSAAAIVGLAVPASAHPVVNVVTVAPQVSTNPTVANNDQAWGGFIDSAGDAGTSTATVGETVQLLITSVQTNPNPFEGQGSFTVLYNPAQLSFVTDGADGGSCNTFLPGLVSCSEAGLENATAPQGKSDGFYFKVKEAGHITVDATVSVDSGSFLPYLATRLFSLTASVPVVPSVPFVPAPPVTLPSVYPSLGTPQPPVGGLIDVGLSVDTTPGVNFTGTAVATITATGGGVYEGGTMTLNPTEVIAPYGDTTGLVVFPQGDAGQTETVTLSVSDNGAAGLIYQETVTLP